jgi:NAD(P)-dependent dehydrogenase (short-subunit alcohol dehydrogenase family)
MKKPHPQSENVPTEDGGYQTYKAAGKLQDKRAVITGGDSGIGRATAILFAMEGADSLIAYLPEEEEDAQETKSRVEKHGRKCYLLQTDVQKKENCRKIVDEALAKMGGIDILFNNAAYQMMVEDIKDLTECVLPIVLFAFLGKEN